MLVSRRISLALVAVCLSLSVLAASALATEPASVTVRVEGFNGVTLLPQTRVTTTATPVPVEGGTCSGTSAGGALYDATHGEWKAKLEPEGVAIVGIEGVDLPPFGPGDYAYWAIWVNGAFATHGACEEELRANAEVVFVGQCFALGLECKSSPSAPDHFLTVTAPTPADAGVGEPVSVKVGSLGTASGAPEALPAGVTVLGGPEPASPTPQGVATLKFTAAGTYTLQARAPDAVASDPFTVCVHNGLDGTCGTTSPSGSSSGSSGSGGVSGFSSASYTGPYAVVARATGLIDGHVYARRHAPRVLTGRVLAHTGLTSVSIELRRSYHGRCHAYDGIRERFVSARCGRGHFFKVSTEPSFSYLLPSALLPGRYVLDIEATDAAGNRSRLARGTSRIVFYVG
jgi:hypothetical protein